MSCTHTKAQLNKTRETTLPSAHAPPVRIEFPSHERAAPCNLKAPKLCFKVKSLKPVPRHHRIPIAEIQIHWLFLPQCNSYNEQEWQMQVTLTHPPL